MPLRLKSFPKGPRVLLLFAPADSASMVVISPLWGIGTVSEVGWVRVVLPCPCLRPVTGKAIAGK